MAVRKSASTASKSGPARSKPRAEKSRFIYHADAAAVGGRIIKCDLGMPADYRFPTVAATSLSGEGGESGSSSGELLSNCGDAEIIYVESATSRAWSPDPIKNPDCAGSSVAVEVKGLAMLRYPGEQDYRIRVPSLAALLTSACRVKDFYPGVDCQLQMPEIILAGVHIPICVNVGPINKCPTLVKLRERAARDPKFRRAIGWTPGKLPYKGVLCTVVSGLQWPKEGLPPEIHYLPPNHIHWDQVGDIFLGELLVTNDSRRLTAVRVHLGCPVEGDVGIGEGETDGHWMP